MKLIALMSLILISNTIIITAGGVSSKPKIIRTPSSEALIDRALSLSINIEPLVNLDIFETFAEQEFIESDIEKTVDFVLATRWREHQKMVETRSPKLADQLAAQGQEYQKRCTALKPVIVMILRLEYPKTFIKNGKIQQTN